MRAYGTADASIVGPANPTSGCALTVSVYALVCRANAGESQQDEYHDPERCAEDDNEAGKPLLQEHLDGRQEEAGGNSAFARGSCDSHYWTCPGDAGFKV